MFNKIYEFFKKILKENYKTLIFTIVFCLIATYPVPYYIYTSGGISDLNDKIEIENGYIQNGSYNLSYVTEIEGNILTYLAGRVIPSWDIVEMSDYQISSTENIEDIAIRDRLSLLQANQTAIMLAYEKAGKPITINKTNLYIVYLAEYFESTKEVKIGDLLIKIDKQEIESFEELVKYIDSKEIGDYIELELLRGKETITTQVKINDIDGKKATGIAIYKIYDYEVTPKIKFKFTIRESGASAGLMTTLAIYDALIEEDLTNGLKIAGTGTISDDGTVGEIGGVKYKLKGAETKNADLFFVPVGNNYEECLKLKEEKKYDIEIVPVETFDDAISYLKKIKNEKE